MLPAPPSVYQVQNAKSLLGHRRGRRPRGRRVSRTVVLLGLTSMFTDISSEMVVAILPLYLVFGLGLSPVQFGFVDGLYQGVSALVRVAAGVVGDRWRRHKDVAAAGYGLSALTRLAIPLVGGAWTAIGAVVMIDRIGKGIRTAPRDAMIALSSRREDLGAAFGVHRALDTAGAMLGPLVAFGILALAPRGYDAVFVASFCFAVIGLAILWLFVDRDLDPEIAERAEPAPVQGPERPPSLRDALALLGRGRFRLLALVGAGLALATVSDAFVYLSLQERLSFDVTLLPLMYIGTALVFMLLAVPVGRLADRIGRLRMFLGGHVLLVILYLTLLLPAAGASQAVAALFLLGAYYAATDGVLMALASSLVPASLQATGMAVIVTGTSAGRLLSAIAFGALWTWSGANAALVAFAVALTVAVAVAALLPIGGGRGDAALA
jgi:MFS family permease